MRKVLLLCQLVNVVATIAIAASWVRSATRIDIIGKSRIDWSCGTFSRDSVRVAPGIIRFTTSVEWLGPERLNLVFPSTNRPEPGCQWRTYPVNHLYARDRTQWYQRLGFDFRHARHLPWPSGSIFLRIDELMVPHWFLLSIFALGPLLWIVASVRRARRARAGRCTACGYDLRASGERCPECGSEVAGRTTLSPT